MDRRLFLASAAALAATPVLARQEDLQVQLDAIRAETGIPALGAMIVTADGALPLQGVSGVRRAGQEEPVTTAARWHLGSNTKAMTAVLFARLVEQGQARWGMTLPELFEGREIDPAWASVTLDQMLGHRAGILDSTVVPGWMPIGWAEPADQFPAARDTLVSRILTAPPAGALGEFSYSNAGYMLAGAAIEGVTGQVFEALAATEIFGALGMEGAGFGAPGGAADPWGHQGASLRPMDPGQLGSDNPRAFGPAGGAHATLEAYSRFVRLFLNEGGGFLTPDSVQRLTTPLEGPGTPYAMGWGVMQDQPWAGGQAALTHDGSNTLWHARAVVAPGRRAAAICVANAGEPAVPAINRLTRLLIEAFPD